MWIEDIPKGDRKMRALTLILIVTATAFAYVADNTEHYNDALAVSTLMGGSGYSPVVQIATTDGVCNYWVLFRNDWYNADDDLAKIATAVGAVGIVSEETTWSSVGLFIMFEDKSVYINTSDCREVWIASRDGTYSDEVIALAMIGCMTVMDQGISDQ
jgi:hypothetical protein